MLEENEKTFIRENSGKKIDNIEGKQKMQTETIVAIREDSNLLSP